jgi:plastocyanin
MLVSTAFLAAVVAACSSTSAGWTYAPAPPPTPVPSDSASGQPSTPASGEPSTAPSGSAAPSASSGASTVTITAQNIAFTTADVTAPAGGFTLAFDNEDAGVPHDVEIKDAGGVSAFKTDIFPGVETRTYTVPALAAGAYTFHCTVHTNMTGTLTVQ